VYEQFIVETVAVILLVVGHIEAAHLRNCSYGKKLQVGCFESFMKAVNWRVIW